MKKKIMATAVVATMLLGTSAHAVTPTFKASIIPKINFTYQVSQQVKDQIDFAVKNSMNESK